MKTLKIKTTGLSLLELYKKYGVGKAGFYSSDPWWKNEEFAKEKPEAGIYEINVEKQFTDLNYQKQLNKLPKGFTPLHPAILTEAILSHFKETGERLLEDWYSRTSSLVSDGNRVIVGLFGSRGLDVYDCWVDDRYSDLGLASARKLESLESQSLEISESLNLEKAIDVVKNAGYRVM